HRRHRVHPPQDRRDARRRLRRAARLRRARGSDGARRPSARPPPRAHRRRGGSRACHARADRPADDWRPFVKLLRELLLPLIAVVCAFAVGALVVLFIGDSPIETYRLLLGSAFSWPDGIGYTLFFATPLIFTGLAVAVALRGGLLNIGAEGQLYIAAFATARVRITFSNLPSALLIPLCCLAGIAAGAACAAIRGLRRARFGSHEVINTIMLNFIAVALVGYPTQYHYRTAGDPVMDSAPISAAAHIPWLGQFGPGLPARIPLNAAFLLALLSCWLVYVLLWTTTWR